MNLSRQSLTPSRSLKSRVPSDMLEKSLMLNENKRKLKASILWGTINVCLLGIILREITFTCPIRRTSYVLYAEYFLAVIFALNTMYYIIRYIIISTKCEITQQIVPLTGETCLQTTPLIMSHQTTPNNMSYSNNTLTPMNVTALSWRTNPSAVSTPVTSFSPLINAHHYLVSSSPVSFQDPSKNESLTEDHCLAEYLKGYEVFDRSASLNADQQPIGGNSFWSHPAVTSKDATSNFRKYQYQLSPVTSTSSSSSPGSHSGESSSPLNNSILGLEIWRHLNVDKITLTKWNSNLRTWLFQTIVERLVKEIDRIDDSLHKHGLSDVKVGCVGIERLRKTAEMASILQTIPTLSILLPFLEVSHNQEYLVKRLRELAKGGCLSDFKWNGGSGFDGKEWNDSLPTDSDIIMHLFATYMDTQLLPNPCYPDSKPFTGCHYIKYTDKLPPLTHTTLTIQQFLDKPPQYRVIVGEEIFEVTKGYNNLFHSILLFLYYVNKNEHGMLGRINLGRAGINVLWIIDS